MSHTNDHPRPPSATTTPPTTPTTPATPTPRATPSPYAIPVGVAALALALATTILQLVVFTPGLFLPRSSFDSLDPFGLVGVLPFALFASIALCTFAGLLDRRGRVLGLVGGVMLLVPPFVIFSGLAR